MIVTIIIMGHECKQGTVWSRDQWEEGREKERTLRGEEDGIMVYMCL
jgi:hypothetical protein